MEEEDQETIDRHDWNIGDYAVKNLGGDKDKSKVKFMYLKQNNITEIGALHLSQTKWGSLTYLGLGCNKIGNRGCRYLCKASMVNIKNLQVLNLQDNGLESAGVSHLTKSKWKQINQIWLSQNKISCNSINRITKSNWKQLRIIRLYDCKLTGAEFLQIILSDKPLEFITLNENLKPKQIPPIIKAIKKKFKQITINT